MKTYTPFVRWGMLSIAAITVSSSLASAAVVVSNLDVANTGSYKIVHISQYVGMSFTVGTDYSSWNLDSVDLLALKSGSPGTNFTVELHADDGDKPAVAAFLAFSINNPSGDSAGVYNYTPTSPYALTANTKYWLTARAGDASSNRYGWVTSSPTSFVESTALTGWSIGDGISLSSNQGSSWTTSDTATALFGVNATAIPEASSLAFLALGAASALRRRR